MADEPTKLSVSLTPTFRIKLSSVNSRLMELKLCLSHCTIEHFKNNVMFQLLTVLLSTAKYPYPLPQKSFRLHFFTNLSYVVVSTRKMYVRTSLLVIRIHFVCI